jgi:hypothetical protein
MTSFFFFSNRSNAQDIYTGTRKNLQTNVAEAVYYTYSFSSKQNIYFNQFSIFRKLKASKIDTIYSVDFNFDRTNNSIKISQFDGITNEFNSKTINFQPLSSFIKKSNVKPIYCVKNYIFNDTTLSLSKDNNASLLFTIVDTINPSIRLNQLISIDGNYKFDLDKLRKSDLTVHMSHSRDYWEWYRHAKDSIFIIQENAKNDAIRKRDSINKAKIFGLQEKIYLEILKINSDKDSLIRILNQKQQSIKIIDTTANEESQGLFTHQMDKFFSEYLSETQCSNIELTGSYKFYVNPNQSISIIKQPSDFLTSWWCTQQFAKIDTLIKHIPLENEVVPICTDDPYNIISKNHLLRCQQLQQAIVELHYKSDSIFKPALTKVQLEVKDLCDKKIPMTTTYTYPFKYVSTSEWEKWSLRNKKIHKSGKELIPENKNIDQFHSQYPKAKQGKYEVRLNTTILNNITYGPDLDSANMKYKYWTRLGLSVGTFAPKGKFMVGNDTTAGEIFYWNLSLIYHHIGVFGGTKTTFGTNAFPSDTNAIKYLNNYFEGGVYVAPGKYFYFKLGLAKYNTINKNKYDNAINESESVIMPIVGGSLMFPVFQIEGGYNFALKCPYLMAGFNIPLNL